LRLRREEAAAPSKNGRASMPGQPEEPSESFPEPRTFPGNWDLSD
jgi:hypothetical protein